MAGINKVIIIGRLGNDPEVRYSQDGLAMGSFSVATSDEWKDKNTGEKKERTEWHKVKTFRKLAENCAEYLSKGSQIYVEGKLQSRSWEKDGVTRYTTEIIASNVQFLDSKGSSDSSKSKQQKPSVSHGQELEGDSDIPF